MAVLAVTRTDHASHYQSCRHRAARMADVRGHDPPFGALRRQTCVREGAADVYSNSEFAFWFKHNYPLFFNFIEISQRHKFPTF